MVKVTYRISGSAFSTVVKEYCSELIETWEVIDDKILKFNDEDGNFVFAIPVNSLQSIEVDND